VSRIGRRFVPQSTIDRRVQAKDDRYARALKLRMAKAALAVELLKPVDVEPEPDDRDEAYGSTCGANCGYCGRCS